MVCGKNWTECAEERVDSMGDGGAKLALSLKMLPLGEPEDGARVGE